jgi:hypothetical protein
MGIAQLQELNAAHRTSGKYMFENHLSYFLISLINNDMLNYI